MVCPSAWFPVSSAGSPRSREFPRHHSGLSRPRCARSLLDYARLGRRQGRGCPEPLAPLRSTSLTCGNTSQEFILAVICPASHLGSSRQGIAAAAETDVPLDPGDERGGIVPLGACGELWRPLSCRPSSNWELIDDSLIRVSNSSVATRLTEIRAGAPERASPAPPPRATTACAGRSRAPGRDRFAPRRRSLIRRRVRAGWPW